ncbi:substrate-binding domain-containing protein [Terasakiella sp. A23]|uniref:substrate-binding domain-containing protein n=1 Tax=Terasakiella sp. FCG-A23 TaxID=3080561 RepID=UPI0029549734|nr:substrate-binding domain-containing protein [Terasakiella sp. A23]MDV7341116.1 substrate-binding domain-containing protein [Terasakiella sp. A23]
MKKINIASVIAILSLLAVLSPARADMQINGYFHKNADQKAGLAGRLDLAGPQKMLLQFPQKTDKQYRIALVVPQLDDTWQTFAYAVHKASEDFKLKLQVYSAQSYLNIGQQIKLLTRDAINHDGVLLAANDSYKLARAINEAAKKVPVVGYANEVYAEGISAKAMVYYHDASFGLGKWVIDHIQQTKPTGKVRIAIVMGPEGAAWSNDMISGFRDAIENDDRIKDRVEIVTQLHGHTKPKMQERLVRVALKHNDNIDYMLGTAPAVERAVFIKDEYKDKHPNLKLIAPYINGDLYKGLKRGDILVAVNDQMIDMGKIAVVNLLRLMHGETPDVEKGDFAFVSGPQTNLLTQENILKFSYESLFGPKDFKALAIVR